MKAYKIIVNYDSGGSFGTYPGQECECIYQWDNLDIAKENLKRIAEHNRAVQKLNGWRSYGRGSWDDYKNERWYCKHSPQHGVVLLTDHNIEYDESCSWVGYFETMNHCQIVPNDDGMRIDV
jgi:hypothetical protein